MKFEQWYRKVNDVYYDVQEEIEEYDTKNWHDETKYYSADLNVVAAFLRATLREIQCLLEQYPDRNSEREEDPDEHRYFD